MGNQIFRVLAIRSFLFLWLAEVFSQIAFNMINFILIIIAFELTNTNTAVSGIVLAFTIPAIVFGLIAGVYVDRWNKKRVLFATNIIRAISVVILAFLHVNLFFIYLFTFIIAVVTQFFIPAETPIIPVVVKKDLLLSANALFGMGIYGSVFIAYALSTPFIVLFGNFYALLIISLLFLLASFFVYLIKTDKQDMNGSKNSFTNVLPGRKLKEEIKTTLYLILKTKKIYNSLFLLTLSQTIILIVATIGPGFATRILGVSVNQFPIYVVAPAALGMVVGAIIIGNFLNNFSKEKMATIGVFLSGFGVLFLPYGSKVTSRDFIMTINAYLPHLFKIDILHIMVFLAFMLGFSNALVFVPSNTILQEETSHEFRGKIYGALNALSGIFSLFPIIIVGSLADSIGVSSVLTGIGIVILLIGIIRKLSK